MWTSHMPTFYTYSKTIILFVIPLLTYPNVAWKQLSLLVHHTIKIVFKDQKYFEGLPWWRSG